MATGGVDALVSKERLEALRKHGGGTVRFATTRVEDPGLVAELEQAKVKFTGRAEHTWLSSLRSWILPRSCSSASG